MSQMSSFADTASEDDDTTRAQTIARERRLINAWSVAGFIIGWWGIVWAQPYELSIVMQLAVCAVALGLAVLKRRRWSLIGDGKRPSVGRIAFWPALALGLRALWDTGFIDWQAPVLWGLAGTAVLVGLVMLIERRASLASIVFPAAFYFSAVWGALVLANVNLDGRDLTVAPVTVLGKSYAGKRTTRFDLFLSHWGDRPDAAPVEVPRSLHARLDGGDTVCVTLHKGALGWRWYDVDMCP